MKGYIQVYTGNGKGNHGCTGTGPAQCRRRPSRVVGQFLKQGDYSEIKALSRFDTVTVEQFGMGKFVRGMPSDQEKAAARKGYARLCDILTAGSHDLVIVDEGNVAVTCHLISEKNCCP